MEWSRLAATLGSRGGDHDPSHRLLGDGEARGDVDDGELSELRLQERVGDLYIEFLDGQRLPLIWDHELSSWVAAKERASAAA